jgi:hypothetical protein
MQHDKIAKRQLDNVNPQIRALKMFNLSKSIYNA